MNYKLFVHSFEDDDPLKIYNYNKLSKKHYFFV